MEPFEKSLILEYAGRFGLVSMDNCGFEVWEITEEGLVDCGGCAGREMPEKKALWMSKVQFREALEIGPQPLEASYSEEYLEEIKVVRTLD